MYGRKLIPLFLVAVVAILLIKLQHILIPFVLSATIAYSLNPLVVYFEMRGIKRSVAVLVVYLALLCLFVGLTYAGISAALQGASNIGSELPDYIRRVREFIRMETLTLEQVPWLPNLGVGVWLREQVAGPESHAWALKFLQSVPTLFRLHVFPMFEMALLIPFLVFFFMMDGPAFLDKLLDFVPARHVEMTLNILVEIDNSFGNYIRGILLQAFFMGILAGIGYWVIGLNYAVYIALLVAATSMIPLLGPLAAAAAGGMVALFQWGTAAGFIKVLAIYGAIRFADDWLLQPMILRRAVHIHPVLVVFTLMAGAYLGGLWGVLFAVPVACMLKVLLEVGWQWYTTEYSLRSQHTSDSVQIPVV